MSQQFRTVTTNAGRNAVREALAQGKTVKLSHMSVGDGGGSPVTPTSAMTALVNERFRAQINDIALDPATPDLFTAELFIPQAEGGFYIREVGLWTEDGTLFAVGNTPLTEKPDLSSGAATDLLVRLIIRVLDAAAVAIEIDPAQVLATRDYVDRKLDAHNKDGGAHETLARKSVQIKAGTGLSGGGTLEADRTLDVKYGNAAGTACQGNDARLSDTRTPKAHKDSHKTGGADALAPGDIGAAPASHTSVAATATVLGHVKLGTTAGTACQGNDARLSNARTPTAHKATHKTGGSDALLPEEIGAARGSRISATTPATAGWYRIAQSAGSISNCMGLFEITGAVSGAHSVSLIAAGLSYGKALNLIQLAHAPWSDPALTKARLVYHSIYSGNFAYLEVYLSQAKAISIGVNLIGGQGWTLVAPSTPGAVPSGYSTKEITLAEGKIVANVKGTAEDIAIGGNAADLASKRGQIGTPPIQRFTKKSADDAATLNLNDDKWWVNGEYSLYLRGDVFSFTPAVNNTPLEVTGNYSARLRVANVYHTGNGIQEFSIAIGGRVIRIYYRARFFNSDNTFSCYPWREAILTSNLGDGIRNINGIISVPEMQGATASTAGVSGLVPPAAAREQDLFLTGGAVYKAALTKITDSVTSTASDTAASAKAVKSAYDRGSAGITAAGNAQTAANNALTEAGKKLPLSGGTLTGNVLFPVNEDDIDVKTLRLGIRITGTDGTPHNFYPMRIIPGSNFGHGVILTSGGPLILGGGESAHTFAKGHIKAEMLNGETEYTYITSDNGIEFYYGQNTGYDAAKRIAISRAGDISMPGKITASGGFKGNSDTATKLATARTIALSGDITASGTFDGSGNLSLTAALKNSGAKAGAYGPTANATPAFNGTFNVPQITVDAKGRVTAAVTRTVKIPANPTNVQGAIGSVATGKNGDKLPAGGTWRVAIIRRGYGGDAGWWANSPADSLGYAAGGTTVSGSGTNGYDWLAIKSAL